MKRLVLILISLFIASTAAAQGVPIYNNDASSTLFGTNLSSAAMSVSNKGEVYVIPSTTNNVTSFLFAYGTAPSSFYHAVSAADITGTTSTQLKAALAGSHIFITNWSCSNTSATASRVDLLDGATAIGVGYLPANGGFTQTFPVPLRGTTNTAVNVQLATTATATRCSISGFYNGW